MTEDKFLGLRTMLHANPNVEEWLKFFEQPDVRAMCRTIAAYPHDLTPRYIWLDWLDEHCPDPDVPKILREGVDSEKAIPITKLTDRFKTDVLTWRGRLRVKLPRIDSPQIERLCCSGGVGFVSFPFRQVALKKFDIWPVNGAEFDSLNSSNIKRVFQSKRIANLNSLELSSFSVEDQIAEMLANSPNIANLTSLKLFRIIGDFGVRAIADSPYLGNLISLNLDSNRIHEDGAWRLANTTNLPNLTSLSLNHNWICDTGAVTLANSPHLAKLLTLQLDRNNIGKAGAEALANSPYLCEAIRAEWREKLARNRFDA